MSNYYFTEEHQLFRKSLRDFLQKEAMPHIDAWEEQGYTSGILEKFGQMGYFGLNYEEQYGGSNVDFLFSCTHRGNF